MFALATLGVTCALLAKRQRRRAIVSTHSRSFFVVSYNMLAESLGSNCIPWVLSLSEEWDERLKRNCPSGTWDKVKAHLGEEYRAHFHKNTHSQKNPNEYHLMRKLWSAEKLDCSADIDPRLERIRFVGPWTIEYTNRSTGRTSRATTLGGLVIEAFGPLGEELFMHILESEKNIFRWNVRGPRVFDRIHSSCWDLGVPSIILLQEYDVHNTLACYRRNAGEETFSEAMSEIGFQGIFFPGSSKISGLGIFWRKGEFSFMENDVDNMIPSKLMLGEVFGDNLALNCDLKEQWHMQKKLTSGDYKSRVERVAMPLYDRKNLALVRLRHQSSGRTLWVFNAHLMTTSRDNERLTIFPGEIRAGELATISALVQRLVGSTVDEASMPAGVILAGDFNTDVGEADVFSGRLSNRNPCDVRNSSVQLLDTGYQIDPESGASRFEWQTHLNGSSQAKGLLHLYDAFEQVHERRPSSQARFFQHATSHNAHRREWIDYIWYNREQLTVESISDTRIPLSTIPSEMEPSDHIPIAVKFKWCSAPPFSRGAHL